MRTVGWVDPAADKEPKKIIEEPVEAPAPSRYIRGARGGRGRKT